MKKWSLLIALFYSTLSFAAPMDDLVLLLGKFSSYKANFAQQSYDQNGKEVQNLTGLMQLKKPDHFYWESNEPYAQKLVSNGVTIWHYDADLEQVVIQEFAKQAKQAPVLVILRDTQSLKKSFSLLKNEEKANRSTFLLAATEKNAALKTMEISFLDGVLNRLVFVDNAQQKTVIQFSSPQINIAVNADLFEFILPEGVDVLYE
jgi:outer membrane lipoprotein carrier protein